MLSIAHDYSGLKLFVKLYLDIISQHRDGTIQRRCR